MKITREKIKTFANSRGLELVEVDEDHYWLREDSAIIQIMIEKVRSGQVWVQFFSEVVHGVRVDGELMRKLLRLNADFLVGSFGLIDNNIYLKHSILGGEHMDEDEFFIALALIASTADDYDDKIIETHGGKTGVSLIRERLAQEEGRVVQW